jgi:hypothetical protein
MFPFSFTDAKRSVISRIVKPFFLFCDGMARTLKKPQFCGSSSSVGKASETKKHKSPK